MTDIIEIYDNYTDIGILNRKITEGKEIELVREYINFRKNNFVASSNRKLAIFLESKVGNSYPDIVFVEFNPENYINWNDVRDGLLKEEYKILYHIYAQKGINSKELVKQLGFSWKEITLSIEKLYDSELITRKNQKWIAEDHKIMMYKIEAVEAKLNNWHEVLQQSIINKNFASESYALSLMQSKPKEDILYKFKRFGVGMYIKKGTLFERINKAKKVDIPVSFNSIVFNEWIGKIVSKG